MLTVRHQSACVKMLVETFVKIMGYKTEDTILPVSTTNNTIKCLDFDVDKIVFKSVPKSTVYLSEINPHNKSVLDVMEMV